MLATFAYTWPWGQTEEQPFPSPSPSVLLTGSSSCMSLIPRKKKLGNHLEPTILIPVSQHERYSGPMLLAKHKPECKSLL